MEIKTNIKHKVEVGDVVQWESADKIEVIQFVVTTIELHKIIGITLFDNRNKPWSIRDSPHVVIFRANTDLTLLVHQEDVERAFDTVIRNK